jgi:hypothetical protein
VPVEFDFPNFKRGSAIYRYSVASPAAAPQLVSPAAREDVSMSVWRISPDETRILFTEYRQGDLGFSLHILPIANPSAAIELSHVFGAQERISGFIHTNAQFSRVYYPTEDGVDPNYTFRLYGADTAIAGSASLIATLPADAWRPEVWELSPDETSVLISAPVMVSGQRYDRTSILALTPGAQTARGRAAAAVAGSVHVHRRGTFRGVRRRQLHLPRPGDGRAESAAGRNEGHEWLQPRTRRRLPRHDVQRLAGEPGKQSSVAREHDVHGRRAAGGVLGRR